MGGDGDEAGRARGGRVGKVKDASGGIDHSLTTSGARRETVAIAEINPVNSAIKQRKKRNVYDVYV